MHRTSTWVWALVGIVGCGGGSAQICDPSEDTEALGTTGHDTAATLGSEGSVDSAESSAPSSAGTSGGTGDATETTDEGEDATQGPQESSSEGGSRCGDDVCDADENEGSCCVDCGCAAGSSCVDAVCTPDPVCGDAMCNGEETVDDCCIDCGCVEGSACQDGACVVLPVCGDGVCNGTETMDDCCDDCGCGDDYGCEANACVCTNAYVHFENLMPDADQFCFATNQWYIQESVAYINYGSGWVYMPDAGFHDVPGSLGSTIGGTSQCCVLDPCGGNQLCPTPLGNYPCYCASPEPLSGNVEMCGENFQGVCG